MSFPGHRKIVRHDGSTDDSWLTYTCGHCDTRISGAVIASYSYEMYGISKSIKWLMCPNCYNGSVESKGILFPSPAFGPLIDGLPKEIKEAYNESRHCIQVNAFTAAELICRKILMHVAVEKGAEEGKPFASYLSFLENEGYITPPMKAWVDLIRQHGNKATHELESPSQERAESTVMFTAELLRLVYEMEYLSKKFVT